MVFFSLFSHSYTVLEPHHKTNHKHNNLHLHLTDDNGWRIEIRKYPLLTQIGAWRADRPDVPFPDRSNPVEGEPTPIGGYYTQDDIREIVAYAQKDTSM